MFSRLCLASVLLADFGAGVHCSAAGLAQELPRHAEPGAAARAVRSGQLPRLPVTADLSVAAGNFDLVVYGGTPGGIACAVRAAREGLRVLLVEHSRQLGGMFTQGLSVMDTLYAGARAPIYDEVRRGIHDYYRIGYGPDSPQFVASRPGHPKTYFEAHVAEQLMEDLVAREAGITVVRGFYPVATEREGGILRSAKFQEKHGARTFIAQGTTFADCSYEADLAVAAGARYRVGREARDEFNEEHAGRIFLRKITPFPPAHVDPEVIARYKRLNLFHYDRWFEIVRPESTGAADRQVQTYNIRAVLTTNPGNRWIPDQPPGDYEAAVWREMWNQKPPYSQLLGPLPNQKFLWNMPEVIGPQNDYPDGDWTIRENIVELHRRATASMLYFLQNDPSVPSDEQARWRNLGFARDEFIESGHLPTEVYARETRRIIGRAIFTENDACLAPGLERTPIQVDSIGVTEWFVDSHASTLERVRDSMFEGEIYLNYISHPGQISYRTILPEGFDNLLVPICLSATHVGWGAIRLEPTWMALGESAAYAAVLAAERGIAVSSVDGRQLAAKLAERHILVSFFNDVALDGREPWVAAVQLLGTQAFFPSYDAGTHLTVGGALAEAWTAAAAEWIAGTPVDLNTRAQRVSMAEKSSGPAVSVESFIRQLSAAVGDASLLARLHDEAGLAIARPLTRGLACQLIVAAARLRSPNKH
ncbi:MAG: pyridine nucleotide-disulfide oxidoreductase [Opitutus sp.]|nr:pyridine nucleotide-disulfide oxidoreductase [Opitutus sp.]